MYHVIYNFCIFISSPSLFNPIILVSTNKMTETTQSSAGQK
ncbi:hypothetical protein HMPREF9257_0193 [Eremococcus coleocola ACS-139-V-Col8]|uniref:Uncharacterized protein n=1 Tax=Eremococcus coleocola ACS-139-V-Col8 TaxID=908337 RepID=E4KMY0_9LACT|nr:hypothetical protein HMPREF9257_0193 [Eremococcus coleocola ACS-139-V-Col8]